MYTNFLVFLSAVIVLQSPVSPRKYVKFYNSTLNFNSKYAVNEKNILDQNSTTLFIDMEFDVIVKIRNITVKATLFRYDNGYKPFLFDDIFSMCKLMKQAKLAKYNYLIQKMYTTFLEYSNCLHCNFKVKILRRLKQTFNFFYFQPGHYYIANFTYNIDFIKRIIPMGKYKIDYFWFNFSPYETIGNYTLYFKF